VNRVAIDAGQRKGCRAQCPATLSALSYEPTRLLALLVSALALFIQIRFGTFLFGGGLLLRGCALGFRLILLSFSFAPQVVVSEDCSGGLLDLSFDAFDNAFDTFTGTAIVFGHDIYLRSIGYQVDTHRIPASDGFNRNSRFLQVFTVTRIFDCLPPITSGNASAGR
jgi:hypothetical protein